jgi:hypothetical protein
MKRYNEPITSKDSNSAIEQRTILSKDGIRFYWDLLINEGFLKSAPLSALRTWILPNSSGTIALQEYVDRPAYRSVSSTTNLLITDKTLNISSGTFTVGIVTAVGNTGITFRIINNGSGIITLDPNASETINGSSTLTIPSETGVVIESDGTNWIIIGKHRLQTLHRTQWIQPIALTTIANGASLNLFNVITDANKSVNGTDGGIYDLSIATDKILTQWHGEKMTHHIRISSTIVTGTDQHYILTLRRYADNSVLGQVQLNRNADTGLFTADFLTYTYSDVDPFVTGGFYIALDNNSGAGVDITGSINLLIVTYFK